MGKAQPGCGRKEKRQNGKCGQHHDQRETGGCVAVFFGPNHGQELKKWRRVDAIGLVALHVLAYGTLAMVFPPAGWPAIVFGGLLIAISVIDVQRFEIPDLLSLLLVVSGLLALMALSQDAQIAHVIAGSGLAALMYLVGHVYMRMRGQPGLGLGDVKLAIGLGLWLGVEGSVWTLLAASLSGLATLVVLALIKRTSADELAGFGVAFGPFLCLSAWAIWLQGNTL